MKPCPFCAEEIQEEAKKCRYCHEWLSDNEEKEEQEVESIEPEQKVSPEIYNKKHRWKIFDIYNGTNEAISNNGVITIYNAIGQIQKDSTIKGWDTEYTYDSFGRRLTEKVLTKRGRLIRENNMGSIRTFSSGNGDEDDVTPYEQIKYSKEIIYYKRKNVIKSYDFERYDIGDNLLDSHSRNEKNKNKFILMEHYEYEYDIQGRLLKQYDKICNEESESYQYLNGKTIKHLRYATGDFQKTIKIYNSDDLIEKEIRRDTEDNDIVKYEADYIYDKKSRLVSETIKWYKIPLLFKKSRRKLSSRTETTIEYK